MRLILCLLMALLANFAVFGATEKKYKVITSTTPIASLIAMLLDNTAEINSIANSSDCPHHQHAKPSDLAMVKDADIALYISDEFDNFAAKLMHQHNKNTIKIGSLPSLKIIKDKNGQNNWHFWLDLNNVNALLEELAVILTVRLPGISAQIPVNLKNAKIQINNLSQIKKESIGKLADVIMLSDSLEYFFADVHYLKFRLYDSGYKSLKYISSLEKLLDKSQTKCLVISSGQNIELYKKFNAHLIQVESENWQLANNDNLNTLFYNKYLTMINKIAACNK